MRSQKFDFIRKKRKTACFWCHILLTIFSLCCAHWLNWCYHSIHKHSSMFQHAPIRRYRDASSSLRESISIPILNRKIQRHPLKLWIQLSGWASWITLWIFISVQTGNWHWNKNIFGKTSRQLIWLVLSFSMTFVFSLLIICTLKIFNQLRTLIA